MASDQSIEQVSRRATVSNSPKIKVLCIDDSATVRELLGRIIQAQPDMELVASAANPIEGRELIKRHDPDVLTLDIQMPRMDGLEFLDRLMRLRPMPVVMISSSTQPDSKETRRAFELGARDVIAKPKLGLRDGLQRSGAEIAERIRTAARSQARSQPLLPRPRPKAEPIQLPAPSVACRDHLIVIGASTGGTEAIHAILSRLPSSAPPVLIAQHMPAGFTRSFAARLNASSRLSVREAQDGEPLLAGHAYLAPGDRHLMLGCSDRGYRIQLDAGPEVNRHRPSVDVLFRSAAQRAGSNATGVLLTGMGKDGAAGMLALRDEGATTIAQDEASSMIFGMPREAIALGAATEVLGLDAIPARLTASPAATRPPQPGWQRPAAAIRGRYPGEPRRCAQCPP
ncbi:chemotaxis response regulator protein-glutamate methylesterase [Halochromatium glycolicum]|uniref:Protein-glutamate methylesterase/protein-glutamine glutaminase n=1 Tax=Halochromatium glycolicum TaxID=85075 RepID=A0AAJ0X8M4_9GAMM|nr:chemotaxis response regulator protein-glutamate methylesterase [Halochromatium glycolicum]